MSSWHETHARRGALTNAERPVVDQARDRNLDRATTIRCKNFADEAAQSGLRSEG